MKIESTFTSGVTGIQKGLDDARQAAHEIATAVDNENPTEVVQPSVDLKQAELQVATNAKVVKAADDMVGNLLDEMA
jgi:hypothetical protein